MAILTVDNMRTAPQYIELPWQVAKAMYHSACDAYDRMGWAEGESEDDDGVLVSRYHNADEMVKITYQELD